MKSNSMFIFLLLLGLAVGAVSGMLGIGGGILLVPALMWLTGIDDQRRAAGITLLVLTPPLALPAVLHYYSRGLLRSEDFGLAALIAIGFAIGTYGGARLVPHVPLATLRLVFGMMLLFVALHFLLVSDNAVHAAFHGLVAMAAAWAIYFGLRFLGRRHLPPPALGDHIREFGNKPSDPTDYAI